MRYAVCLLLLCAATACAPTPPAPPSPHAAAPVHASFSRTWNAVIDEFANRNIPIRTMDRASGFIATDPLSVSPDLADDADCGKDFAGVKLIPTQAVYNVLVRGDSAASTVRITVKWTRTGMSPAFGSTNSVTTDCSSTGQWETAAETKIKTAAEGPAATAQ